MRLDEARAVLGIGPDTAPDDIRIAYRVLLRRHHPDVAGPAATEAAARLIEAYTVVRSAAPEPPQQEAVTLPTTSPTVFEHLREAADEVGEVTYVDPNCGIIETMVRWEGWPASSLLVTVFQEGPDVLAQCTLEPLESRPGPPIAEVVAALRGALAALDPET